MIALNCVNIVKHRSSLNSLPENFQFAVLYAVSPDPSSFRYYIAMALNLNQSYKLCDSLLKKVHTAIVIPLFGDLADKL